MRVLHVGCGGAALPEWIPATEEVRLDIDPYHKPDIVASMTDIGGEDGVFDAVFSCHSLEHLHPYDVTKALAEFYRVLKPRGNAVIFTPNLDGVQPTDDVVYVSPSGPVTGRDLIYGMARLSRENPWMAHQTGFIPATMIKALTEAGFAQAVANPIGCYNLLSVGIK